MADFLRTGTENSKGDNAIKQETLKILDEAKKIQGTLTSEDVQKEYEEVRLATIGALKNLRIETHDDLDSIKSELGNIDVYSYAEGDITQDELGSISREFSDLQKIVSSEKIINTESQDLNHFGTQMLSYITDTNNKILSGGAEELENQLDWYLIAFGGKESSSIFSTEYLAYNAASAFLSYEDMLRYALYISNIQASGENTETKLFQLSQVLYEVGKECGAGSELETAHNIATREIIKKIIESDSGNFAVGFNNTGYFMTEKVSSTSSELEIGTYLCSLNKSGNLNKETLLQVFSPTELFVVLERYKNGEFGDENIQGLFGEYLKGFDSNMESIIFDFINTAPSSEFILQSIESGLTATEKGTPSASLGPILKKCELCGKINLFTLKNLKNISPEAWGILESSQPEFTKGLKEKLRILENTPDVIQSFENFYLNQDIPQSKIHALKPELEKLINEIGISTCSIEYIKKIKTFNETHFPDTQFNFSAENGAGDIISSLIKRNKDVNEIAFIDVKYRLFNATGVQSIDIQKIFDVSNITKRNAQLNILLGKISNTETKQLLQNILITQFELLEDIQAQESRSSEVIRNAEAIYRTDSEILDSVLQDKSISPEKKYELIKVLAYTPEDNIILGDLKNYLALITNEKELLSFFQKYPDQLKDIPYSYLSYNLQQEIKIAIAFPGEIEEKDFTLLNGEILSNSDFVKNTLKKYLIDQNLRSGNSLSGVQGFIHKYLSVKSSGQKEIISILSGFMKDMTPKNQELLKNNIPLSLKRASKGTIFEGSYNTVPKQDIAYFIAKINGLKNLDGAGSVQKQIQEVSSEIDAYVEFYGINTNEELVTLFIQSGLLHNSTFIKHNLGRSSVIWNTILDSNLSDISFLEIGTRSDSFFQEKLLEKIQTLSDFRSVESSLVFSNPKDIMTFFGALNRKINHFSVEDAVISNPKYQSLIIAFVRKNGFENLEADEKIFVKQTLESAGESLQKLELELSDTRKSVSEMKSKNNEEYESKINTLCEKYGVKNNEIKELKTIIEKADGSPIALDGPRLLQILGTKENVSSFLQELRDIETKKSEEVIKEATLKEYKKSDFKKEAYIFLDIKEEKAFLNPEKIKTFHEWFRGNHSKLSRVEYIQKIQEDLKDTYKLSPEQQKEVFSLIYGYINGEDWSNVSNPDGTIQPTALDAIVSGNGKSFFEKSFQQRSEELKNQYQGTYLTPEGEALPIVGGQNSESFNTGDQWLNKSAEGRALVNYGGETRLLVDTDTQITLSQEDIKAIKNNPEAEKNLVNTYLEFTKLGLERIWQHKEAIFKVLGGKGGFTFNAQDGDYLDSREINVLLSTILYTTTQNPQYREVGVSLEVTRSNVLKLTSGVAGEINAEKVGKQGNKIEKSFLDKFTFRNSGDSGKFNYTAFYKAINGEFLPNPR